jgi:hypothetical protein
MNNKLRHELAKEYFKLAVKSSFGFYALLVLIAFSFSGRLPAALLFVWLGVSFASTSIFLFSSYRFKRRSSLQNSDKWLNIYTYLVLLHDLPWGLIGPISFLIDDDVHRMLTLFMLGESRLAGLLPGPLCSKTMPYHCFAF